MGPRKSLKVVGLALLLATACARQPLDVSGPPCENTNSKHDLPEGVVTLDQLNTYVCTLNGKSMQVWDIINPSGDVVGRYAVGRTHGMHFREYATRADFLNGDYQTGPTVPGNYPEPKKIR